MSATKSNNALEKLRAEQDSNMLFATHIAHANGNLVGATTNWSVTGQVQDEQACDICKCQETTCVRPSLTEACTFCTDKRLQCVGPGNNRRTRTYEVVNQTIPGQEESHGEYSVGQAVHLKNAAGRWDEHPHLVMRAIYRQISVVLDDEASAAVPVESVRPFGSENWVNEANATLDGNAALLSELLDPGLTSRSASVDTKPDAV